jgi:DNA-binding MarR family transcriptional regulator
MKIEEAIKQSQFKNNRQKAMINVLYTANWLNTKSTEVMKDQAVTLQQFNVLRILRGAKGKPVPVKYIKERMLDKMPDVSRIVDKLVKKDYVERKECASDRRNVDISITQEGLSLLEHLDSLIDPFQDIFAVLSEEELILLNNLLDKLRSSESAEDY